MVTLINHLDHRSKVKSLVHQNRTGSHNNNNMDDHPSSNHRRRKGINNLVIRLVPVSLSLRRQVRLMKRSLVFLAHCLVKSQQWKKKKNSRNFKYLHPKLHLKSRNPLLLKLTITLVKHQMVRREVPREVHLVNHLGA